MTNISQCYKLKQAYIIEQQINGKIYTDNGNANGLYLNFRFFNGEWSKKYLWLNFE